MKLLSKSWTLPFKTTENIKVTDMGSSGVIRADMDEADLMIQNLCAVLFEEGWEIKSVIPLISGYVFGTALMNQQLLGPKIPQYGGGYGFGASFTEGVIVLAQKWIKGNNDELEEKPTFDHHSFSNDDSSILDLTDFENKMNIHQQSQSKCPICKNDLLIDMAAPKHMNRWCFICEKNF